MAQPTVNQVWSDPDFQGLPMEEKRKVLTSIDPDFAGLPGGEQDKVLGVHTLMSSKPAENAGLQKVADKLSGVVSLINNPGGPDASGGANAMAPGGNLFQNIGERVATSMPNHPYIGAGLGTAVSMANPENWLTPAAGAKATFIQAAKDLPANEAASGVPFTRPEISQNPVTLGLQSRVQNSPTGGLELNPFKADQAAKLDAFQQALQNKLGTSDAPSVLGSAMKDGLVTHDALRDAVSQELYKKVPQDTRVPTVELNQTFQKMGDELSPQIGNLVRKYTNQGREVSPVTGSEGPAGTSTASPSPDATVNTTSTMGSLMDLRSRLSAIQRGGGLDGLHATLLKRALNNDINSLANTAQPLQKLMGGDAASTLKTATSNYAAKMALENHPVYNALQKAELSQLPDIIFKGGSAKNGRLGLVENLDIGRAALGDEGFALAQRQFFTDLLNKKNIGAELDKYSPEFLNKALSSEQQQALQTIDALKKRAASAGRAEPMAGSSKMNMWLALLTGMATSPLKTLLTGGALPYAAARAMTNTGEIAGTLSPTLTTGAMAASGNASTPTRPLDVLRRYLKQPPQ